jgi:hypothetical protein
MTAWIVALLGALPSAALWTPVALGAPASDVTVVNMIPAALSGETNQDSEPNLAVNPNNVSEIAGSAFTRGAGICPNNLAPIFVSTDGGSVWAFNCIVPSDFSGMTSDITVRFSGTTDNLYAGILRRPGSFRLNILRTNNFTGAAVMTVLVDRNSVDQPYVQATTEAGRDRVYVGDNLCCPPAAGGRTANIDQSLDAANPVPPFTLAGIEVRATSGQDGPPIRPALHQDGTIYAAFYGWRNASGNFFPSATITTDVVVVRDDNRGMAPTPFDDLVDPGDGLAGVRVVQNRTVPWENVSQANFCQERFVGSNISIAVDPNDSSNDYLAWADRVATTDYTLHVRRSTDRGLTWSDDLRTVTNATNPALAINSDGTVGFLYQQCTGTGRQSRWVTHLEFTDDDFVTTEDLTLANVPANVPLMQFIPYIGDYVHLMTAGRVFYGIFSANNTPDNNNFPNGVTYQRNADFTTNTLLDNNGQQVRVSIDPYFLKVVPPRKKKIVYKYAAKIICGLQSEPDNMRLAQGFYATAINVHNPHPEKVKFTKTLSLTFPPPGQKPGKVNKISKDTLWEDQALEIDCIDIKQRLFPNGFPKPYIKGFVTVKSSHELDVTGVYTTRALAQKACCKDDDRSECCGSAGDEKHCDTKPERGCCDASQCPTCCVTVAGGHSSIDVEQIDGRAIEEKPDGE